MNTNLREFGVVTFILTTPSSLLSHDEKSTTVNPHGKVNSFCADIVVHMQYLLSFHYYSIGYYLLKTLGLTSPRTEKCGQTWYTNFFITLKAIKGMECASLMPIDFFFEAPRLMDSCNFTDDHTSLTRDVRWYNVRLYSTLYISTMEANSILLYSRRNEICDSVSVVKPNNINKDAVALNNAELY